MKKISIIVLTVIFIFILAGCRKEETYITDIKETIDECILDESCHSKSVFGSDNPNEVMFNMVKNYSLENNLYFPIDKSKMIMNRISGKVDLRIMHFELMNDLHDEDFSVLNDLLVELYGYINSNLNSDATVSLSAGHTQFNHYTISYRPESKYFEIHNFIESEYNGDLSAFYNQIKNIIIDNDFDIFLIYFEYTDVQVVIYQNPASFDGIHFLIQGCFENDYCLSTNKQLVIDKLQELLPDENIE